MPYASFPLIAPVVHEAKFARCDVMLVTGSQPRIEGRTLITLVENVRALLARRQRQVTVDPAQRIPDSPAPQREQALHLITTIAGADQRTELHSGSCRIPTFALGTRKADVFPQ